MHTKRISIRTISYLALLIALEIVLNRFCSINTMGLKIGFSFVPIVVAANLFGPAHAAAVYALADFLGAILFPIGPYHPGFTVCAALMGLTWGLFLRPKNEKIGFLNILAPSLINNLIIGLFINTVWVAMLYGSKTYVGWFLYRLSEYAILVPLNLVLVPIILRFCRELKKLIVVEESPTTTGGNTHKKVLLSILLGIAAAGVLFFGILYANNDIGRTAGSLEKDVRSSQKIKDDWIVDGSVSDSLAAYIAYSPDETDYSFSIYVNRPGLSFGYFFKVGGNVSAVSEYIAEFSDELYGDRAFVSMNMQNVERLEIDNGNGIEVIEIDSSKPFAVILPRNAGSIRFYDVNGNIVEAIRQSL